MLNSEELHLIIEVSEATVFCKSLLIRNFSVYNFTRWKTEAWGSSFSVFQYYQYSINNKYLPRACYVPGTILGTGDKIQQWTKLTHSLFSWNLHVLNLHTNERIGALTSRSH